MNLPKAIEILSDSANRGVTTFDQDFKAAQKLGIEAIKREQQRRKYLVNSTGELLPGETED